MNRLIFASIIYLAWLGTASAQEPPLPSPTSTPAPTAGPRPELNIPDIPLAVEPAPLVPNTSAAPNIPAPPKKNLPSISELDTAFQQSSLGQAVEEQKMHLEWRRLKNRTVQDAEVVAAKRAADSARTELEKRNLMRSYYKIFYGRMQALADTPQLKAYLEQKKNSILASLDQPQVRPAPTPRPEHSR